MEDNPTDVFVTREVLREAGIRFLLRTAETGQDALQFLETLERDESPCPSLVLLDLNLPKISGFEVLRRLRGESRCRQTPVIVITSSSAEEDRQAAQRLGANAFFQKPTDLESYRKLAEIVQRVVGA